MIKKWIFIGVVGLFSVALKASEGDSYGIEFDPDEAFGATMEEMNNDAQPPVPPVPPQENPLTSQEGLPVYNDSPGTAHQGSAEHPSYSPTHWNNYPPYPYPSPYVYPYPSASGNICRTSEWSYCYMRGWGYPVGSPCTCTVQRVNLLGVFVWFHVPGVITRW